MINILIVDDQKFTRKALRAILKPESDFIIAGEAENGIEAIEFMNNHAIDIALVDLDMPKMDGFELTQKICQDFPNTKVIILSGREDRYSINKAVNFGVRGYLLKDTSVTEVIDTINYVQRGYFQLGPGLFEKLISESIDYEVTTSEHLSQIESKSERDVFELKQEILIHKEQVRQELVDELNLEINNLKLEFRDKLNIFQTEISNQVQNNFEDFASRNSSSQPNSEFNYQRYYTIVANIKSIEKVHKLSFKKLKQEVVLLRYGLIFLLIAFIIEKTIIIFF